MMSSSYFETRLCIAFLISSHEYLTSVTQMVRTHAAWQVCLNQPRIQPHPMSRTASTGRMVSEPMVSKWPESALWAAAKSGDYLAPSIRTAAWIVIVCCHNYIPPLSRSFFAVRTQRRPFHCLLSDDLQMDRALGQSSPHPHS